MSTKPKPEQAHDGDGGVLGQSWLLPGRAARRFTLLLCLPVFLSFLLGVLLLDLLIGSSADILEFVGIGGGRFFPASPP